MYISECVFGNHDRQVLHYHTKIKISHKKVFNIGLEGRQIFCLCKYY